ncbi:MAG: hypothetical protein SCH68_12030 [Brevefilum sp.]|nr:hypothetical protein [Brevefilum sp.]
MNLATYLTKFKAIWSKYNTLVVLIGLVVVFWAYTVFLASNLQTDIVPDEPLHFNVAKNFAKTWGIPDPEPTTRSMGTYIKQNPYLAYWIYGRVLNVLETFNPTAGGWQQLIFLRIANSLFSIGTLIFVFLISKELITNKWWQLLPVFALSNTMMFVLLSSGVNYDNLVNMFCAGGIYYLIRVLNHKDLITNSLAWMIFISLGAWVKETVLPLALAMAVVWVIFLIKQRPTINLKALRNFKTIFLISTFVLLVVANFSIYGVNLIKHQSLTPSCKDYYSDEFCRNTPLAIRRAELALPEKPNLLQAFKRGYPEPLRYAFDTWIPSMLMKTFGIMGGQKSYYPINLSYFKFLFYWLIALIIRYFRGTSFKIYSLAGVVGFYTITLFIKNFDIELAYGFLQVALQGRYIFPVIGIIYSLFSYVIFKVPNKLIRYTTLIAAITLFVYSGPIRFLLYADSVFSDWFI